MMAYLPVGMFGDMSKVVCVLNLSSGRPGGVNVGGSKEAGAILKCPPCVCFYVISHLSQLCHVLVAGPALDTRFNHIIFYLA